MSDKDWKDSAYLCDVEGFIKDRGIRQKSAAVRGLRAVNIKIGHRDHDVGNSQIYNRDKNIWVEPICELHVTHALGRLFEHSYSDGSVHKGKVDGKVMITYLAATSSGATLRVSIDLSKLQSIKLAQELIAAAAKIEESEQ